MKIAIIGAGVSGLVTAYYLKRINPNVQVSIYEKASKVGGNADTFNVYLTKDIVRWVDMGVNDFNKATYKELNELWQLLGIMNDKLESPYCSPLINSASYSDDNGSHRYTIDVFGKVTVPPGSQVDSTIISSEMDRFKHTLAWWFDNQPDFKTTVGEWLQKYNFNPHFIQYNLYPRMNGMYFTMENSPAGVAPPSQMPMWMVAHYYILQEGYSETQNADEDYWSRQYFVNGSARWLEFLAQQLSSMGVNIGYNYSSLHVDRYNGRMTVYNGCVKVDDFDKVIFATHADDTYNIIDFKNREYDPMVETLKQFSYSSCDVYVHQDASMLAPQGDCNETYNIHIYNYSSESSNPVITRPYTITYIVNDHQNDPARGIKDPTFYVTVNPYKRIDPSKILYQTNGQLAKSSFRHCKLDVNAMNAQIAIDKMQLHTSADRDYYFAGSFARGAGLHVECVIHALDIANKILNPFYKSEQTYDLSKHDSHFAPKYIRERIASLASRPAPKPLVEEAI